MCHPEGHKISFVIPATHHHKKLSAEYIKSQTDAHDAKHGIVKIAHRFAAHYYLCGIIFAQALALLFMALRK